MSTADCKYVVNALWYVGMVVWDIDVVVWDVGVVIGGGPGGLWPLLNLRLLHRIVIFAIENHFRLAKWPPLLSVLPPPGCILVHEC